MDKRWSAVVQRIVQVLGIQPGDLVHVRDAAGRIDVLLEISLAIEMQGAASLVEFVPAEYRQQLWNIDFALPGTTCKIGGQAVVFEGDIVL